MKLGACRWAAHLGTSAGLIFGCLVGMLPLLFMDPNKNEKLKRAAEREALFDGVVKEAGKLLEAEECALLVGGKVTMVGELARDPGGGALLQCSHVHIIIRLRLCR